MTHQISSYHSCGARLNSQVFSMISASATVVFSMAGASFTCLLVDAIFISSAAQLISVQAKPIFSEDQLNSS
jgi:hypothetical protein